MNIEVLRTGIVKLILNWLKILPAIFHTSHLIMQVIGKLDVKISVMPNELEKYMALTFNKNLLYVDSMQFINSSLDALVENLSENDFKYLSQEFNGELFQ